MGQPPQVTGTLHIASIPTSKNPHGVGVLGAGGGNPVGAAPTRDRNPAPSLNTHLQEPPRCLGVGGRRRKPCWGSPPILTVTLQPRESPRTPPRGLGPARGSPPGDGSPARRALSSAPPPPLHVIQYPPKVLTGLLLW